MQPMKEIRKIIETYDLIDHSKEKVALASVVNVEESSYRRIGARMLISSSGQWTGGISGGCLEGHALKKAQQAIFNNQPSVVTYDTMDDDANEIGVGLGCNGRIQVLFKPINPLDENQEINILRKASEKKEPSILIKIINTPHSLDLLGKVKLVSNIEETFEWATISAKEITEAIKHTLKIKNSSLITFNTQRHGELTVLFEFIRPEVHLIVIGDNYDISAMTGVANEMGWRLTVIGSPHKMPNEVFQKANHIMTYDEIDRLDIHEYTAVILMSHDYKKDKEMLEHFARQSLPYLGLLGPKKRFDKMTTELPNIDFSEINFIYSPAGLETGAESPQEIALSIIAEIVTVFRKKNGGFLRDKKGSIHQR